MTRLVFPNDVQFWYETLRSLGHAAYGGSEPGEVLAIASRIVEGDYDSWYAEWNAAAESLAADARAALAAGHPVSARDGLLRASNYYRSAEFFLHGDPNDPRILDTYDKSVRAFRDALPLLPYRVDPVLIPFAGTHLQGYLYRAGDDRGPVVIMHNGFDGTAEEMHFCGAAAALERGYHVLVFDGPGQPSAIHHLGLPFRPDWENVVTPVLDWLLAGYPDLVDSQRVALFGFSMGGLLAPRAAAYEHRLGAVIAVDGVYDLGALSTAYLPMPREEAEAILRCDEAPEVDAALEQAAAQNPIARWGFTHGAYVMGVKTPRQFLASYLDYTLADGIAERITAPVLVASAEEDEFFRGQPEALYEHITAPKKLLYFASRDGGGAHCHGGAERLASGRVFDWLDETFAATNGADLDAHA